MGATAAGHNRFWDKPHSSYSAKPAFAGYRSHVCLWNRLYSAPEPSASTASFILTQYSAERRPGSNCVVQDHAGDGSRLRSRGYEGLSEQWKIRVHQPLRIW